jgi:hypothetical protein
MRSFRKAAYLAGIGFVLFASSAASAGPDEIIYLANCLAGNGQESSEADYYSDAAQSRNGQIPDARSNRLQTNNKDQDWEAFGGVEATFPDGNVFRSFIAAHNGKGGFATNNDSNYVCYQDINRRLWGDNPFFCNAVYFCERAMRPWSSSSLE